MSKDDPTIILSPKKKGEAEYKGKKQYMLHLSSGESHNDMNMYLPSTSEDMSRFSMEELPYAVSKLIDGWDFSQLANWIHTQSTGAWSVYVLADIKKRPGHSQLVTSFETKEAATIFKLFQL